MSRSLFFSDGFTSASAPTGTGGVLESFLIDNNATGGVLLTLDSLTTRSAFSDYELVREDNLSSYIQTGSIIFKYDGAWSYTFGNYSGDELFVDAIVNTEHVVLSIDSVTGEVTYDTGNMVGTGYNGTLKLNIVRII